MSAYSSGSRRKCFVAAKDLTQLDWGHWACSCLFVHVVNGKQELSMISQNEVGYKRRFTTQPILEPYWLLEAGKSWCFAFSVPWNSLSRSHPHEQQRHFWHSSSQLGGAQEIKAVDLHPAARANAVLWTTWPPWTCWTSTKKHLSHPCICEVFKEQSWFSLIANYYFLWASFPPTFLHSKNYQESIHSITTVGLRG